VEEKEEKKEKKKKKKEEEEKRKKRRKKKRKKEKKKKKKEEEEKKIRASKQIKACLYLRLILYTEIITVHCENSTTYRYLIRLSSFTFFFCGNENSFRLSAVQRLVFTLSNTANVLCV